MPFSYSYTTDIWPALITFAIVAYLGSYGWRQRHISAAIPFAIACLLGEIWIIGAILELLAVDFSTKVFWVKFQAIWQLPVAAVIACFILQYAGLGRWLTRRTYILLFIVPLLSVVFIITNDWHHLIWTGFRMNGYVVSSPGRLYWFFNSYIYLLGLLNLAVLIWLAIYSPRHRLPVAIIVFCQIFARIVYAMDKLQMGLIGPGESIFFTIGLMAVAYAVALLGFHAIDPVAAARKAVLRQMHEGLIVLDLQDRIVDANPMVTEMFGIPDNIIRNKHLADLLPVDAGDLKRMRNPETAHTEITLEKENSPRHYRLNQTTLKGRRDEPIGRLILLHDITEQKRAQTRILEQQKEVAALQERERLARELHDGIGQTLGYVGMQTQTALKWMHGGNPEKAGTLLERLVEVTKDAHADVRESILSLKTGKGRQWSFIPALKEYIDRFQVNYGIRTELVLSAGIDENTLDPETGAQLLRAIQEGLTNARKHSGASNLRVCMERNGSMAQISITDDGHGFDASRLERGEDGHFGLVFMRERMAQIGGTLKIESMPDGGTALTMAAPIGNQ
ncbi:MAG: histidine kinase N-terminal 7TM domain-containing protein [Desulfosalsimonadaceae bacterium]